jgi:sugar transferase (PEP-CTERM/EpsH1 system associated)
MSRRPRLLYLAHRFPLPLDRGDRIRNFHVLEHLAADNDVSLGCLCDEPPAPADVRRLGAMTRRLAVRPVTRAGRMWHAGRSWLTGRSLSEGMFASPPLAADIAGWTSVEPFDAVVLSASSLSPYLQVPGLADVPLVADLVDVDSQKFFDYAAVTRGPKRWLYAAEARRVRAAEARLGRRAACLTVVSEREAAVYRRFDDLADVRVIPNGVTLPPRPAGPGAGAECLFVGVLDYPPNVDAVTWFARHAWRAVRAAVPSAEFTIVGRDPSRAVRALAGLPGVNVVGPVPEVAPYLERAAVVVVPLRVARGIQNKLLEALAAGKAVVASPEALAPLRLKDGRDVVRAETPAEWVVAVTRLLSDADVRRRLGKAGRAYVARHHGWAANLRALGDAVREAIEAQAASCASRAPALPGDAVPCPAPPGSPVRHAEAVRPHPASLLVPSPLGGEGEGGG